MPYKFKPGTYWTGYEVAAACGVSAYMAQKAIKQSADVIRVGQTLLVHESLLPDIKKAIKEKSDCTVSPSRAATILKVGYGFVRALLSSGLPTQKNISGTKRINKITLSEVGKIIEKYRALDGIASAARAQQIVEEYKAEKAKSDD